MPVKHTRHIASRNNYGGTAMSELSSRDRELFDRIDALRYSRELPRGKNADSAKKSAGAAWSNRRSSISSHGDAVARADHLAER